ncbi:MAG: trypsin-like peptidase domain-containing protein [Bacteroidales bacterium]|nr:trypsin-like peptidase domain-containing protein [Bacteroidales bacterium]
MSKKQISLLIIFVLLCLCNNGCAQQNKDKNKKEVTVVNSAYVDLTYAAEKSIDAVVHINAEMRQKHSTWDMFFQDPFFNFFNPQPQSRVYQTYGSGVIISADGYIVTNNHVVEGAEKVNITLNDKRTFKAKIIGTDVTNDLAVLKIESNDLKPLVYGNSDDVKIGEWVLAVGNPYNLTSTVTAGIVSAKARNLNQLSELNQVSTYIQTDAAVNSGNSGGALVNTKGELVGINAAIVSQTGNYSGYSFAIPVNIVKKVVKDIQQYGKVQKVDFGASFVEVNAQTAEQQNLSSLKGIQVFKVFDNHTAQQAGIQEGDILLQIDQKEVNSFSELKEILDQHIPGDEISCRILRNNKPLIIKVKLKNKKGTTEIIRKNTNIALHILGAKVSPIDSQTMSRYGVKNGLVINKLYDGALKNAGVQEGFVIIAIDKRSVETEKDIDDILGDKEGNVLIEGFYPNGFMYYYTITI